MAITLCIYFYEHELICVCLCACVRVSAHVHASHYVFVNAARVDHDISLHWISACFTFPYATSQQTMATNDT